jgi:phosphatidylglycerophosphatase A
MTRQRDSRRLLLSHPAGWIATGFGIGFCPVAPGTAAALAALLPWWWLQDLSLAGYAGIVGSAFVLGVASADWCVRRLAAQDPACVVWDEIVGQWLTLTPLLGTHRAWQWILLAVVLFRIFDIVKPWPVGWIDRAVEGGWGVMLDDVFAAGYAMLVLGLVRSAFGA